MDVTQFPVCCNSTLFKLFYCLIATKLRQMQVLYRVVRCLEFHQMILTKLKINVSKSYDWKAEVYIFRGFCCMIILIKTYFIISQGVFSQFWPLKNQNDPAILRIQFRASVESQVVLLGFDDIAEDWANSCHILFH